MTDAPEDPSPSADADDATPRRRRRVGWRAVLLWSPLFLLTALVLVIVELPYLLTPERVRTEAMRAITDALGVSADIERVDYHPLTGVELFGVRLGPPEGFEADVFSADRIAVRYDLGGILGREVRVTEVALDDPVVTLETRGGRTNVDAILAHLNQRLPPSDAPPPPPGEPGPLVPLTIVLDGLSIGPLTARVVGEGPNAEVRQVWLQASGRVGPEALAISARLEARAADDEAEAPPLQVRLPPAEGRGEVRAVGALALTVDLDVTADTARGLALRRTELVLDADPRVDVTLGDDALPTLRAPLGAQLTVDPTADRLALQKVRLDLGDAQVVRLGAEVRGVRAAVEGQLGELAGAAALAPIGWPDAEAAPEVTLEAARVEAPLGALSPYAAIFLPGTELAGALGLRDVRVEGSPAVLQQGLPKVLEGALVADEVRARVPAQALDLARLDGAIALGRAEGPDGAGRVTLAGELGFGRVRAPGATVGGGRIGVDGFVPRLAYPLGGAADLGLTLSAEGIDAPPAAVARASVSARLSGTDPLLEDRAGEPLIVQVDLHSEGIVARTGTVAPYRLPSVTASARASLDRLLVPTEAPIRVSLTAQVPRVSGPGGLTVRGAALDATGSLPDPRRGFPAGARLDADLTAQGVRQADLQLSRLALQADLRMQGRAVGAGPLAGVEVPERVDLKAALKGRVAGDEGLAGLDAGLSGAVDVVAWPGADRVGLRSARLALDEAVAVTASGRVRRASSPRRHAVLDARVERLDVAALLARAPRAMLGAFADAAGRGEVQAALHFEGRPADIGPNLDLRAPPVALALDLSTTDVGVTSTTAGVHFAGLTGATRARLAASGAEVDSKFSLAEAASETPQGRRRLVDAALAQHLGFEGGVWRMDVDVDAARVEGARGGDQSVSGLAAELVARYPPGGALDVSRLRVEARSAGVELDASGRLSRGPYGVIVPELRAQGRIRFQALQAVLHELDGLSGGLEGRVALTAEDASRLALRGEVRLDDFGYAQPDLAVEGATGLVPLDQAIVLPPPEYRPEVASARGQLGDDLEARLEELQARLLAAQGLLTNDNVILVPPRHADHEALRPYRRASGSDLRIERVRYAKLVLTDVIAEAQWTAGQLRLDHFEASMWGGDVLADFALQVTPDLDVRARARATLTNLNLDVAFALMDDRAPEQDDKYVSTATMDLSFALQERVVNGRIQVTKLTLDLMKRALVTVASVGGGVETALNMSRIVGVRPTGAQVWIAENLLNAEFEWQAEWLAVRGGWWALAEPVMWPLRNPLLIATLGSNYVIPTVNGAIKRLSLSGFIDQALDAAQPEVALQALTPHVRARPDDGS